VRAGPPDEVLAGDCGWWPIVSAWRGSTLLEPAVPVAGGTVTAATSQAVPERLTLVVPRWVTGDDWLPPEVGGEAHPLAAFGQELDVSIVVSDNPTGRQWVTRVGRFLIAGGALNESGKVEISATGRLQRVADDKSPAPMQPLTGGTLASEARRLLPLGMGLSIDPALVDRACPAGMSWSSDRLAALQEIADAWPALLRTDEWGQVQLRAPLPQVPTPALTLRTGPGGTVSSAPRSWSRTGRYNRWIVRSSASGTADVQAVVDQLTGPMAVLKPDGSPGDYGIVAREYASPLLTTVPQCQAAGETMRAEAARPAMSRRITCASDPRIDLDVPVAVLDEDSSLPTWGWVTGYQLPLTVGDGAMTVDVGVS